MVVSACQTNTRGGSPKYPPLVAAGDGDPLQLLALALLGLRFHQLRQLAVLLLLRVLRLPQLRKPWQQGSGPLSLAIFDAHSLHALHFTAVADRI